MTFFSMERMPFTNNIGTEFLFQNSMQEDIKNKLRLTVETNSFALLTGQPGTGKSTVERRLKDLRSASKDDPKMFLNI